jgi:hypothetical protein
MSTSVGAEVLFWAREGRYVKRQRLLRAKRLAAPARQPRRPSHNECDGFRLIRFRDGFLILAGTVDVGDDVEVLVELDACAQSPARLAPAAEQAG